MNLASDSYVIAAMTMTMAIVLYNIQGNDDASGGDGSEIVVVVVVGRGEGVLMSASWNPIRFLTSRPVSYSQFPLIPVATDSFLQAKPQLCA